MAAQQLFFNQVQDPAQTSPQLVKSEAIWIDTANPTFIKFRNQTNSGWIDLLSRVEKISNLQLLQSFKVAFDYTPRFTMTGDENADELMDLVATFLIAEGAVKL